MTDPTAADPAARRTTLAALRRLLPIDDEMAYILPMAVFCAITAAQALGPQYFAPLYTAKTLLVPLLLILLWPHFARINWSGWQWGLLMGILGVVQWVLMGKLMLKLDLISRIGLLFGLHPSTEPPTIWNPFVEIHTPSLIYPFIAVRWLGPTFLVPFMEEFFWRDYLWRRLAAPNDFKLAKIGEWDPMSFWLVPVFFAMIHVQWITALTWGLMIALLLLKTRALGPCIIMHGVTNFLLGAYVLWTHDWYFW